MVVSHFQFQYISVHVQAHCWVYSPALQWVPEIELVSWRSALFEVPIDWSLFLHMQIVYSCNSVVQPQETQGEIYPLYGGKGVESLTYKMLETFIT